MSLKIGGGTSNQTGSFNQNGTQNQIIHDTTTPSNPGWVTDAAPHLYDSANTLAGANPQSYVAGPNSLLTTAASQHIFAGRGPCGGVPLGVVPY
jgi:hypothetical protein